MSNFMIEIAGMEQAQWQAEYGNETTSIVEGGEWIVGCLVIARETNETRSKL
jgi:hypothetical protein